MHDGGMDIKYPERRGWKYVSTYPSFGVFHRGYYSDQLRPCPCCRRRPVFEESTRGASMDGERARIFVGICPTCEIRTREDGTLREAVMMWQRGEWSEASITVARRMRTPDIVAVRKLCKYIVEAAIDDAIMKAQRRNNITEGTSEEFTKLGKDLDDLERFFRNSVFMWELDPDGVISEIRRVLYPELKPEDRTKIPLRLSALVKGKEIVEQCTRKKNSSEQQFSGDMRGNQSRKCGANKITRHYTRMKT